MSNSSNKKRKTRVQFRGWSAEQESALNSAFTSTKPTPNFWKKVAKLVPGKSAEECFDRIQSDHLTPPEPRSRSRSRIKSSPLTLSIKKLFTSPSNTKNKRGGSCKRSQLLAQKTVRQLLQKQQSENQDYEPDFFSVLEPTVDPFSPSLQNLCQFSSPEPNLKPSFLTRCEEMSSSPLKTGRSSQVNSSSNNAALISPPVLKQIKNKALHEKYINRLNKRKVESRCGRVKNVKKASHLIIDNPIKVAKCALLFEAQDVICQYRGMQSSITNDNSDVDYDYSNPIDEDEDEDER